MTTTLVTDPTGASLQRLAEASWERIGGGSRLIFEGETFTGSALAARTRRFSQGLRDAGLRPGERVVVCMANCVEVGITYNAVWRAGAVTTPVLFLLSDDELRHVLVDSEAAYVVTTPEFLPKVGGRRCRRGDAAPHRAGRRHRGGHAVLCGPRGDGGDRAGRYRPDRLAALLYTGGTTGRSKGVMLSHNAMSASAWAATSMGFDPEVHTSLLPLPVSTPMAYW